MIEPMILSQVVSRTHYTTVPRLHPLHCSHVDIADYEFWAAIFILLTVKKIHINLLFFFNIDHQLLKTSWLNLRYAN